MDKADSGEQLWIHFVLKDSACAADGILLYSQIFLSSL